VIGALHGGEPCWAIWRENAVKLLQPGRNPLAYEEEQAAGAFEVLLDVPGSGLMVVGMRRLVDGGFPGDPEETWVAGRLTREMAAAALGALAAERGARGARIVKMKGGGE